LGKLFENVLCVVLHTFLYIYYLNHFITSIINVFKIYHHHVATTIPNRDGKEAHRFRYGSSFSHVWGAKEKSFAAKQTDRVTKLVGDLLKVQLHDVISVDSNFSVVHSRRKVSMSVPSAVAGETAEVVCIAEAAWNTCLYTIQNLHHWKRESLEGPLTLQCQTFVDE
jgi:hypothetical protein